MANPNLRVSADFDPSRLERGFKSASASAQVFARELQKVERAQQAQGAMIARATREMEADFARRRQAVVDFQVGAGRALLGFGAAVTVGLGLAAKAASDWESAFAGVRKVVDGSPEEIAALEQQLRGLARTLPATAAEIAGVAESAGQMGVARQDIASFTQTMIALGVSTNLSADEAAAGLGKLGNIMGVLPDQAGRAGSALVALGNAGESTESDILAMALRIGGAGRQIGLTEAQVLGFANALSSVGIEAESGGSSISRVMLDIQQAVANGGEKLALFAKVSGVSAKEFASRFRGDAAGAVPEFIAGLGRMSANGENTVKTLAQLNLSEIRVRDTLLRSSGAAEKLAASVQLGSDAWADQTALLEEASKRYDTAESRIQIARNQINDAAIDLGAVVLPAFVKVAEAGGVLAETFADLPGPVQATAASLGVAAAAVGLLGGAALIAVPKVAALLDTLDGFGGRGAKAATGLRRSISAVTGVLAGPWGVAIAAATVGLGVWTARQAEAKAKVDALKGSLDQQTGSITEQTKLLVYQELRQRGVVDAAAEAGVNLGVVTEAALGNADAQRQINDALAEQAALYQAAASSDPANSGALREKVEALALIREAYRSQTGSIAEAREELARENEALGRSSAASDSAASSQQGLAESQQGVADTAGEAARKVDDLIESLNEASGKTLTARDAARGYQKALDDAAESLKDNGKNLDIGTEKGRANQEALDAIAESAGRMRDSMLENGASQEKVRAKTIEARKALVETAESFGLSGKAAREYAARVLAIPDKAPTKAEFDAAQATRSITDYIAWAERQEISLRVRLNNPSLLAALSQAGVPKAEGGAISGPGTGTSDSVPALLSNGEHVLTAREVQAMGGHGSVYRFRSLARAGLLPAFADGGAVGDDKERLKRLRDLTREYRTDLRRGGFDVTGGIDSAYQFVDKLLELSRDADLSKSARGSLAASAAAAEPALRRLYRESDRIANRLERARDRLQEMTQLRDQVSSSLQGGFDFADAVAARTTQFDRADGTIGTRVDVAGVRADAAGFARKLRALADRLERLRKLGMPTTLLREIAGLGPDQGVPVADAWITAGRDEIGKVAKAYRGIDRYADLAGTAVADSMYRAGIASVDGLIEGLESRQDAIERQMERIARGMERALKRALGIASPSKVGDEIGGNFASSVAGGVDKRSGRVKASSLGLASSLTFPLHTVSSPVPSRQAGRAGDTYVIQAPTTAAWDLVEAGQALRRRQDAVAGR